MSGIAPVTWTSAYITEVSAAYGSRPEFISYTYTDIEKSGKLISQLSA